MFKNPTVEYLHDISRNDNERRPNSNFDTKTWRILKTDCNKSNWLCCKFYNILPAHVACNKRVTIFLMQTYCTEVEINFELYFRLIMDFERLRVRAFISAELLHVFLIIVYVNLVENNGVLRNLCTYIERLIKQLQN
jgi:hypothetical protein